MADDPRSASPCGFVRGEEGCGVQLKMAGRVSSDIGAGPDRPDPSFRAQQEAAYLILSGGGQVQDLFQTFP